MTIRKRSFIGALVLVLLAFGVLFAACGTDDPARVALTHSFDEGDSWIYEVTLAAHGSVDMPGLDAVTPLDAVASVLETVTVDDVTDGVATITARTEILKATLDGVDQDIEPQADLAATTMRIDERGRILSVTDATGEDMLHGFEPMVPFDINRLTGQMGVIYPEGGLAEVGEEWSETLPLPMLGFGEDLPATVKAKVTAVDTVDGRELATIEYYAYMPVDLDIDFWEMMKERHPMLSDKDLDLAFKIASKGFVHLTGTARVDTADGQAESVDGALIFDLNMEVTEAPPFFPADQRGPFSIDLQIKTDLVRK